MTTKNDLIEAVALHACHPRADVTRIVECFLENITDALFNGEKVAIHGFGTFETKQRAARTGRNPRTGEPVEIAASTTVAFKPAKALKDSLN
jgi:DNA-binding protein HU-beta